MEDIIAILNVAKHSASLNDFLKVVKSEEFMRENIKSNPFLLRNGRIEYFYTHYDLITRDATIAILNKISDIQHKEVDEAKKRPLTVDLDNDIRLLKR